MISTPAYWHRAYKGAPDPDGETHQAHMVYNKTVLLRSRRSDLRQLKPSSKVAARRRRDAGATQARRAAQA